MNSYAFKLVKEADRDTLAKVASELGQMFFAPAFKQDRSIIAEARKRVQRELVVKTIDHTFARIAQ